MPYWPARLGYTQRFLLTLILTGSLALYAGSSHGSPLPPNATIALFGSPRVYRVWSTMQTANVGFSRGIYVAVGEYCLQGTISADKCFSGVSHWPSAMMKNCLHNTPLKTDILKERSTKTIERVFTYHTRSTVTLREKWSSFDLT